MLAGDKRSRVRRSRSVFVSTGGAEPTASHTRVTIDRRGPRQSAERRRDLRRHARRKLLHQRGHRRRRRRRRAGSTTTECSWKGRRPSTSRTSTAGRRRDSRYTGVRNSSTSAAAWCGTTSSPCSTARAPTAGSNGLYVTADKQHVDNHTTLDHARPHGDSRELYKGVSGRPLPHGVQRAHHRAPGCAEDRRQAVQPQPAALGGKRWPTRARSSRSMPTTCAAPTVPPWAGWTTRPLFYHAQPGHRRDSTRATAFGRHRLRR